MTHFKALEFRVIAILLILALAGSVLILIQRNEKASRFSFPLQGIDGVYKYHYGASEIKSSSSPSDSAALIRLAEFGNISNSEKLDINHCGYYDFEALPGIGPALADRIVAFRDSAGGFRNIDELSNVKGIGPAKLAQIRSLVEVK